MNNSRTAINLRFLVRLSGTALLVAVVVHFVHGYQVRRNAGVLLNQAEHARARGDLLKAADYYKRYLALDPFDAQDKVLVPYGTLLADPKLATTPKAMAQAFFMLERALRRSPERSDVRKQVIRLAMNPRLDRYGDALEHLDALKPIEDGEILKLRGDCLVGLRKFKEARAAYEEALSSPATEFEAYLALARLLRAHDTSVMRSEKTVAQVHEAADKAIDAMLVRFGNSSAARLAVARYYRHFAGQTGLEVSRQRIREQVDKAHALAPDELEVILAKADLDQSRNETVQARGELERGLKLHGGQWALYQALAHLEMLDRHPEAALAALQRGLEKLPGQIDLLWNLGHLLAHQGRVQEASEVVARLEKSGFPRIELDYLEARLQAGQEHWQQAARLLEKTYPLLLARADQERDWLAINLIYEANLLLAHCYEQLGDPDAAVSVYARVVARYPLSTPGRLGLARMEWAVGRLDNAVREYRVLMGSSAAPAAAWIECAQVLIDRNLKRAEPDWRQVSRLLEQAQKFKAVEIDLLRAEVLASQGEFDKAKALLESGRDDRQKRSLEVWVGLSNLEQRRGKVDLALALLNEAEERLGDRVELRQARCRYWSRRGGDEAPRALDQIGQGLEKYPSDQQHRLLPVLAASYLQIGEVKRAQGMWGQIADKRKNDLRSRMALFDLAFRENDQAVMIELVQAVRAIEGDEGTLWRYCEASRLIAQAEKSRDAQTLGAAATLLAAVEKRRPTWGRAWVAQAQISDLLGNYDAALEKYTKVVFVLGEDSASVIRRAVQLLSARERFNEAEELIQRLRAQTKGTLGELDRISAEIALRKQDPSHALLLAEKADTRSSKNYKDHLWLARIMWSAGKNAEAEAELQQAVKLAPTMPEAWVALVFHFARLNEKEKAKQTITLAERNLPKSGSVLALAQCYEIVGNKARSDELYDAALTANPDDSEVLRNLAFACLRKNQLPRAKEHFERIITLTNTSPSSIAEAKRALAVVLASKADYQDAVQALKILGVADVNAEKIAVAAHESNADVRAKIVVLARAQNPRQRRQAINLLEGMLRRQQITRDEQFLLAKLYESVGDWYKAREQFLFVINTNQQSLMRDDPGQAKSRKKLADQLAVFCNGLLHNGMSAEAEPWLAQLEKLEPKELRTVSLRSQLLHKQGQAEKAVPALIALEKEIEGLTGPVASVLEQIQQVSVAEEYFKKYVAGSKRADAPLALAQFYGRQKRPDEALALCQSAWKSCPAEQVASTSVFVLYTAKVNEDQCRKVSGWLEAALEARPKSSTLLNDLAAVHRIQGNYSSAITLYRRIVANDPNDTLALNNLAWLLALSERNAPEALRIVSRAIELDGPQAELLDTRAVAHLLKGDPVGALNDLDEAISERPTAQRCFHRAQAHYLAKNRNAALEALQKAIQLGLNTAQIDPLEQTAYRQLLTDLGVKSMASR